MSRHLMRGLYAVAAASFAIIMVGSTAGATGAAAAARPDQPKPGLTLSVALEDNTSPDLFYTGTNSQVWQVRLSNTVQRVPASLGGQLLDGPTAVWVPSGTLPISGFAVFGRGTDNALWWRYQTSSGWSSWASLGGVLTSKPTVSIGAAGQPGALSVFARGKDGAVWDRVLTGTSTPGQQSWSSWANFGGKLLAGTAPAATGNASGLFVAGVGTDGAIWVKEQLVSSSMSWSPIGGKTTADPGITSPSPNAVTVFVRGTDNAAWSNEFFGTTPGATAGWHTMGGNLTSGVAAITRTATSETSVYVLGGDSLPWTTGWPAYVGWANVGINY